MHARRLPKHHKSSSQPTISPQHARHGRLHRPRLRPRPPTHDWLSCRCSPGKAHGTIINTMLTLFLDLRRPRVLGISVSNTPSSSAGLSTPLPDPQISGPRLGASASATHHPSSQLPLPTWSCPSMFMAHCSNLPYLDRGSVQDWTPPGQAGRTAGSASPLSSTDKTMSNISRVSSFLHQSRASQTS